MPPDDIRIEPARPGHEEAILALARRSLGWGPDPRFTDLYRWKHDENPLGPSPRWVALDGDRVVGFRVFLRWRFRRPDGSTVDAVRAVDTATDPEYQGRGIFRSLTTQALEDLRADGVGFVFNTPNDQSRPGYLKMGWIELGRPPLVASPRLRSLPRILRARVAAEHWSEDGWVARPAPAFFADTDALAALARPPGGPHGQADRWRTDRTPAWLAWRYGLAHLRYQVLTTDDLPRRVRSASEPGAAVFRVRRRGPAVEATVSDVFAVDPTTRRALLRAVRRVTGADYVLAASAATTPVDPTPAVRLAALSPLVTWRSLTVTEPPTLDDFAFEVGDLELF